MRAATSRAPGKDVWAPHSSVSVKTKKAPKEATAAAKVGGGKPPATRNARAEALVQHVSQLPAYLAWAPANAPPTTGLVAQYLEAQVAEVASQLEPIQQAGNYERLVLLLAELLHGDLACGITPGAVRSGVLRIVNGCVAAIAAGELGALAETVGAVAERRAPASATAHSPLLRSPGATLRSSATQSVHRLAGAAAPIESLLPPLIDQPARTGGAAGASEDERAAAEMEVWENYMATARAATTAEDMPRGASTAAGPAAAAVTMLPALAMTAARPLSFLPEALCALIDHCTAAPLVCLTLRDQQCVEAAVQDVLAALLATLNCLECDAAATTGTSASAAAEAALAISTSSGAASAKLAAAGAAVLAESCQAVRLAAVEGISRVLAAYLEGAETTVKAQLRPGTSSTGPLPAAAAPSAALDGIGVAAVFEGVTQQWVRVLAAIVREEEERASHVAASDVDDSQHGDGGEDDAAERLERGNEKLQCAAEQLHWLLRTALQIIAAEQHEATRAAARGATRSLVLPARLVPVALRTLAFVATALAVASRATTYAQLIVDVLWGAALLAPREAALQFMYASLAAESAEVAGTPDTRPPAMDLFLALLHQFNVGHSVTHCELRDDLLCLLAFLLRHDTQFAVDDLVARRGVTSEHRRASLEPTGSPVRAPSSPQREGEAPISPLCLSPATVEAINAVAALLFETTCGAELTTTASRSGATVTTAEAVLARDGDAPAEGAASMLLSRDAARRHALRFQSIATSAARRRELLEFKKYGWQLLEVHCGWQLAHLTHREFVNYHDTSSTGAGGAPSGRHHQRTAPVGQAAGEESAEEAATAALWGLLLSQLGFLDVLLLYVDTHTEEPAVVAWTREALVQLEMEAWRLLTSMILFTQCLDSISGGVRVRRRRRCGGTSPGAMSRALAQQQQQQPGRVASPPPWASPDQPRAAEGNENGDSDLDDGDDDQLGVLYGADMHFIAAGGVQVALRFVRTAPAEVEHVKRAALITLAAIARTSSSAEARGLAGSHTDQELALVKAALTQHAPSLVPFLVKLIQEVDTFVDAVGVPAAAPPLISSVVSRGAAPLLQQAHGWRPSRVEGGSGGVFEGEVHGGARWSWLPQSAVHCAFTSWCLLRCIGDVVLAEVGNVRELALPMIDDDGTEDGEEEEAEALQQSDSDGDGVEVETHGTHSTAAAGNGSHRGSAPHVVNDAHHSRELFEGQWENTMNISLSKASSSGSSMGPLEPVGRTSPSAAVAVSQRRSVASSKVTGRVSHSTSPGNGPLSDPGHPCMLLRSVHSHVLRIPELFAEHSGVDLLTSWLRHTLGLCLTAHPKRGAKQAASGHQRIAAELRELPQLTAEEVSALDYYSDLFLLLLDVFRAIVLGCKANEMQFVQSGGVHGMLDVMEAYALAHGLIHQAARHARLTDAGVSTAAAAATVSEVRESEGVLNYATTLLSDLLESCPRAIDAFATWRSRHILASPLTPDMHENRSRGEDGIEAVQLLLCLWASEMPAHGAAAPSPLSGPPTGLQLLRLHLRPALRTALKETYVSRLLQRRAKLGVLQAEAIRNYYRYLHTDDTSTAASTAATESVSDAVVLAYMEKLMSRRSSSRSAVAPEQHIALLVYGALGLCMKVYACLSTVGFDCLRAAEAETQMTPSMGVRLSALERSYLVQVAALPTLCVDEIAVTMAEVALEDDWLATAPTTVATTPVEAADAPAASSDDGAWRPTTPDRQVLRAAAKEAAVRAGELDQLVEVGAQVQQARESQLYNRFLVTQLRQPVGQPADGRPGAVPGTWKTQRRQSTTRGSAYTDSDGNGPTALAADLAASLSTRLAGEQLRQQQRMASSVRAKQQRSLAGTRTGGTTGEDEEAAAPSLDGQGAPAYTSAVLGSSRTPYASLMNSVNAAAQERLPVTPYSLLPTPRRPSVPLTQRHQHRQAMIARSLRKLPHDPPSQAGPHTR